MSKKKELYRNNNIQLNIAITGGKKKKKPKYWHLIKVDR